MHDINTTTYAVTILYLPLEGGAVRLQFHPVHLSIRTLPFTIPYIYIFKISIYGMRDFNRPVCNSYSSISRSCDLSVCNTVARSEKQ